MNNWSDSAIFYHIYPLGFCNAPKYADHSQPPQNRINKIKDWIPYIHNLGCNALYLGPIFQSTEHGYDTADYYNLDKRLGTNQDLKNVCTDLKQNNIRVVLDGVFNHVGRDFWAFRDLLLHGENSRFKDWFSSVNFNNRSPYGDPFSYEGWNSFYNLVKLNLHNPEVKSHIFGAVEMWIQEFGIDGLRLDVAEIIDKKFLTELAHFCKSINPNFWLVGEMIHGDYTQLANQNILDSTTNYEMYKGLYSSHNDKNYFEIAYTFNRQFGANGIYRHLRLYNFTDNHDVTRISSILKNEKHLYTVYALLFAINGIPSIYYGSETGLTGSKNGSDDSDLRPSLNIHFSHKIPSLYPFIQKLIAIRKASGALRLGNYKQLYLSHEQLVFSRTWMAEEMIIVVNSSNEYAPIRIPDLTDGVYKDYISENTSFKTHNRGMEISIPPYGTFFLKREL